MNRSKQIIKSFHFHDQTQVKHTYEVIAMIRNKQEEFEYIKGVIRIRKSKARQHTMAKRKKDKQKSKTHYTEN
jgi:hypothetical protein